LHLQLQGKMRFQHAPRNCCCTVVRALHFLQVKANRPDVTPPAESTAGVPHASPHETGHWHAVRLCCQYCYCHCCQVMLPVLLLPLLSGYAASTATATAVRLCCQYCYCHCCQLLLSATGGWPGGSAHPARASQSSADCWMVPRWVPRPRVLPWGSCDLLCCCC
jgi:hypothetical protein